MTVALRGTPTTASGNTASMSIAAPAGLTAGDAIVIWCICGVHAAAVSGFTALSIARAIFETLLWRTADGSEGSTFTITGLNTFGAVAVCAAFSGADGGATTFWDPYTPPAQATSTVAVTTPSPSILGIENTAISSTADGDMLLWFFDIFDNTGGGAPTVTFPAGFAGVAPSFFSSSYPGQMTAAFGWKVQTTHAAAGTQTGGLSTSSVVAGQLIAVRSTAGGPPPPAAALALGPVIVEAGSGGSSGFPPIVGVPTVTGAAVLMAGPIVTVSTSSSGGVTFMTAIVVGPVRVAAVGGRVGPGGFPVPGWRGRWRLTLHNRAFTPKTLAQTMIAELVDARGRRLDQAWNTPATLTFTLDGRSQSAALVEELLHDVVAWRWDDQTGVEQPVFRGIIAQAEDQITTESHTVTYTCHDYAAVLQRRLVTATYTVTGRDQDLIVGDLLGLAAAATSSAGVPFSPASFLPVSFFSANPNGSLRGLSGQLRTRTYYGSQNIGTAVDDLSKVSNGFDYDVLPSAVDDHDSLRIFYPQQGVTRTGIALQYGSTVAALTRTVDSSQYANYVRVLGNNGLAAPTPQLYSDNWMAEAQSSTPTVGLWAADDNDASDTVQSALDDKALGDVLRLSDLEPSYTLVLSPDAYTWGNPNMGDTVPLIVQSGRLNVNTAVRVLGITYDIGDDGQEDVTLTVGRPVQSLPKLFAKQDRSIKALDRR